LIVFASQRAGGAVVCYSRVFTSAANLIFFQSACSRTSAHDPAANWGEAEHDLPKLAWNVEKSRFRLTEFCCPRGG